MFTERTFRRAALASLLFTLAVILWGAFVRATGSGAGCGSHWPTCHGEVLHRPASIETAIEMTHRVTSGLSLLGVLAVLGLSRRVYPTGHRVRRAAGWSMFFMVMEAALGAGLVLFELVAGDASLARGFSTSAHLVNTFLLVAAMTLTLDFAWGGPRLAVSGQGRRGALVWGALGGALFVGVTGAIAALGDTLFPARSLAEGLAQDFSGSAHIFLRLRTIHPFAAGAFAVYVLVVTGLLASARPSPRLSRRATWVSISVLAQVAAGLVNLLLLAPVSMQMLHLLLADGVWIALVLFGREALAEPAPG
jgi:cytochrome c oxidase assembly protein subunit 15